MKAPIARVIFGVTSAPWNKALPDIAKEIPWRERILLVIQTGETFGDSRWIVAGLKVGEPQSCDEGLAINVEPVPRHQKKLIRRFLRAKLGGPIAIWYTESRS